MSVRRRAQSRIKPCRQTGCLVRVQHSYGGRGFNPGDLGLFMGEFTNKHARPGFRVLDLKTQKTWDLPLEYIHVVTLEDPEEWL